VNTTTTNPFWDRHAAGYAKSPIKDEASYQHKLKLTQDYLRPDMEVLEFACGTGSTALIHAPFVKHIRATDISQKMIEIARQKAADAGVSNIIFETADIQDLPLEPESLDVVMGHSILHLLPNKEQVIQQVHRALKPGGLFITSTMCCADAIPWFRPIGWLGRQFGLLPLIRFFTAKELQDSIMSAGFESEVAWQPSKKKALFVVARKI